MKIYKEYIPVTINTPIYADLQGQLVTVENQKNHIVAYFDTDYNGGHKYEFFMAATGIEFDLDEDYIYLKSLMLDDGDFVVHIYVKEIE